MITLEKSLRHMAWSNQQIFEAVAALPDEVFKLRAFDGEWPVGKIMNHFIGSAEWYRFLLAGVKWQEVPKITNSKILMQLKPYMFELDQLLIAEAAKPDSEVSFIGEDKGTHRTTRSMVLAQSVSHAAEHKGQLATILRVHGHELNLDRFDLWNFESLT